jgi:dipeptidyl aminopeptidase/acylaminoacyl peptidase
MSGGGLASDRPPVSLDYFALSPDGRRVAFEYGDRRPGRVGEFLGLFDWESGKLTPIPNPPGKRFEEPSFSSDGKRLVVTEVDSSSTLPYQISTIELSTLKVTEITER